LVGLAGIAAFALLSNDDPGDLAVQTAAEATGDETDGSVTEPDAAPPEEPAAPAEDEIADEPTPAPTVAAEPTVAEPTVAAASEPFEDQWDTLPMMMTERQQLPAVVTSSGKIWMIGGLDAFAFATRSVEFYDPLLQTWARCECDLPIALNHHMATTYDDLPVVLGGWVGVDDDIRAESSARVLQLRNGEWVDLPPLLEPRIAGTAVTVGNEIIVTGGQDAQGNLMSTTEIFDGTAWRLGADLPTPREHVGAATDGRFVYVAGGRLLPGGSAANVAAFERYDPATDEWTMLPDLPTARGGLAVVSGNNSIITLGGEGPSGVFDEVEQFDLATQTWKELPPLQPGRHGLAAAFFRRSLYAIGGAVRDSHLGSTGETSSLRVSG
jgi:non-specific serine/threonine protein kinase